MLHVQADAVETLLYFRDGRLVFAEAGSLGETLGRLLVAQGTLTLEQYTAILEQMTAAFREKKELRFGEIAVQLGFLTPEQVSEALATQVARKFVHCMQWEQCVCSFDERPDDVARVPQFPVSFEPLILEGVRQHFDDRRCAAVLDPIAELWPSLRADSSEVAQKFRLDGRGLRLLRMIDGENQIQDLLDSSPAGEETRNLLVALAVSNALSLTRRSMLPPAPEPEAVVQPVAPTVSRDDEPSVVILLPLPRPIEEVAPTRSNAPPARPQGKPDDRQARVAAEQAYQLGCSFLATEEWGAALRELRRAHEQCPGELEYHLALKWAEFRVGTGETDWRGRRAALREIAERAVAQDLRCAIGHHALGHLLAIEGQAEAAAQSLRTTLRYDPDNRDAKRQLRLLAKRRVAQGPPGSTPLPPTREKGSGAEIDRLIEEAMVARTAGKATTAVGLLRRARAAQPGHPVVAAELALALLVQDAKAHSREANALAREARRADPSLPLPYVVLGRLLETVGERDRARQLYVHALTLDPECVEAQEAAEKVGS